MKKPFENPFAMNPEKKFGLPPGHDNVYREDGMQGNRSGVRPVQSRPGYQGTQAMPPSGGYGVQTRQGAVPSGAPGRGTVYAGAPRPGTAHAGVPRSGGAVRAGVQHPGTANSGAVRPVMSQAAPMQAGNIDYQASAQGVPSTSQDQSKNITGRPAEKSDRTGSNGQPGARTAGGSNADGSLTAGSILDFSADNLMRGFVVSEVLGRPKCLRRGRW